MIIRNLGIAALAEACGVSSTSLSDQFSKDFPSRRLRLVIETVIGMPIWSSREEFDARQALAQRCGFDPFTVPESKVRKYAAGLRVHGLRSHRRKASLISLLQRHFAANPNPTYPQ